MAENTEDKKLEELFTDEMYAWAEALEEAAENNPDLKNMEIPDEMLDNILERGRELDDEDDPVPVEQKPRKKKRMKRKTFLVLAAALVVLFGFALTGQGSRIFNVEIMNFVFNNKFKFEYNTDVPLIVVDEMDEIYEEIEEKLGILSPKLGYIPNNLEYSSLELLEDVQWGDIVFFYESRTTFFHMEKRNYNASTSVYYDGEVVDIDTVDIISIDQNVPIYTLDMDGESVSYVVNFSYASAEYSVMGQMPKEEFLEMIKNIYF